MQFDIITIFPGLVEDVIGYSILGRAREREDLHVDVHDLRDWTDDAHRSVDDEPYGGGAGMVMKVEPVDRALKALGAAPSERGEGTRVVLLSPQGRTFDQQVAGEYASLERLVLVCGRYEGVDERVAGHLVDEELSVGDYVLSGGELPALIVLEAVSRLLPGVLGHPDSPQADSHAEPGRLDFPHYTRPREYRGWEVPEVLLSGDHEKVARWRRKEALRATVEKRPELLAKACLEDGDRELLAEILEESGEAMKGPQRIELERFLEGDRREGTLAPRDTVCPGAPGDGRR